MTDPDATLIAKAFELLARIVEESPLTYGDVEVCHFCGAPAVSNITAVPAEPYTLWADHEHDCAWAAGRRLLGLDLEHRHTVKARIIDADTVETMGRLTP